MAALSVMISPPGSTRVGTCRIGFTGATRSLAPASAHVAPSTSAYGIPRSVSAASTAMDPEPEAPYRVMASTSRPPELLCGRGDGLHHPRVRRARHPHREAEQRPRRGDRRRLADPRALALGDPADPVL